MSIKFYFLIALIIGLNQISNFQLVNGNKSSSECLITNKEYPDEYLLKSDDVFGNRFFGTAVYLHPISKTNEHYKLKWQLIPTSMNDENIFFIKSVYQNTYLCASELELNSNKVRRQVYTSRQISHNNCEWRIEKSGDDETNNKNNDYGKISFLIWNTKFRNQLYAGSYFFKADKLKRNIFLKNDKSKIYKSDDYKWLIDCL
jgi:hypothetical protein